MQTVLFDLDGTIGNTLPLCIAAFRAAIEPLAGRQLSDAQIIAAFGPSEEGTIATLLPERSDEGFRGYLEHYDRLHPDWPGPFDGMRELLNQLKASGVFVGLVTGKGPKSAALTLERYGLSDYFDVTKTGSPVGPIKDRCIEEIIDEYSLTREDTLYVGDSPSDVTVCRQCRIPIVAAAWAPTADLEALRAMAPEFLFTSVPEFSVFMRERYGNANQPVGSA